MNTTQQIHVQNIIMAVIHIIVVLTIISAPFILFSMIETYADILSAALGGVK